MQGNQASPVKELIRCINLGGIPRVLGQQATAVVLASAGIPVRYAFFKRPAYLDSLLDNFVAGHPDWAYVAVLFNTSSFTALG